MLDAIEVAIPQSATPSKTDWSKEFRVLYEAHGSNINRFLMRLGVKPNQLEDARQEVFLEAYRYLPQFRGECSLKTWLYRICISEARRTRKRESLRGLVLAVFGQHATSEGSTRGELTSEQSARLVERALAKLTRAEREVFVLYELEGMAGTEIATVLGIPEASVWRRLHYARERFRGVVEEGAAR